MRPGSYTQLANNSVCVLFCFVYFLFLRRYRFFRGFCTVVVVSSSYGGYVAVRFPFVWCFPAFYAHGLDFDISLLCENLIEQNQFNHLRPSVTVSFRTHDSYQIGNLAQAFCRSSRVPKDGLWFVEQGNPVSRENYRVFGASPMPG